MAKPKINELKVKNILHTSLSKDILEVTWRRIRIIIYGKKGRE